MIINKNSMNNDSIAVTKAAYNKALPSWKKVDDLNSGTAGMRKKRETYLKKYPKEKKPRYDYRLSRTFLLEKYKETVTRYAGKPFEKPVVVEGLPEDFAFVEKDVDGNGKTLTSYSMEALTFAINYGVHFLFIDHPVNKKGDDQTDGDLKDVHPLMQHITAKEMIWWTPVVIDGNPILQEIRFMESVTIPSGFGEVKVQQIRVIKRRVESKDEQGNDIETPGVWEKWRLDKVDGKWKIHDHGTYSFPEIPVIPVYGNYRGFFKGLPALEKIADKNLEHWIITSDLNWSLFYSTGVWVFSGAKEAEIKAGLSVGPGAVKGLVDPQAKIQHVEPKGESVKALTIRQDDIKTEMDSMGAEPAVQRRINVTATGQFQNQAKVNTDSAIWVREIEEKIEKAIEMVFRWKGKDLPGAFKLNVVYDPKIGTGKDDFKGIKEMFAQGVITAETYIREAQRRGIISDDINPKKETATAIKAIDKALELIKPRDDDEEKPGEGDEK